MERVDEDMIFSSGCRWVPGQAWPQGSKAGASQTRHPLKRMKKTFPASGTCKVQRPLRNTIDEPTDLACRASATGRAFRPSTSAHSAGWRTADSDVPSYRRSLVGGFPDGTMDPEKFTRALPCGVLMTHDGLAPCSQWLKTSMEPPRGTASTCLDITVLPLSLSPCTSVTRKLVSHFDPLGFSTRGATQ